MELGCLVCCVAWAGSILKMYADLLLVGVLSSANS